MDTLDPLDPIAEYEVRHTMLRSWMALSLAVGVAVCGAVVCGAVVCGAELDVGRVAADAKWIAHVDLDAVKTATLAEKVHNRWLTTAPVKQWLASVETISGVDLIRDLHGVTFYGNRLVPQTGVVLIDADVDGPRLLGIVCSKPDYKTVEYGEHTLHTWTERKGKPGEHSTAGCILSSKLLVVGRDIAEVKAALDVLDGKSAALEGSDSPLAGDVPAGAVVIAGVTDLAEAELPFKSPIVTQSEMFWAAFGQQDADVFVDLKFVAKSDEAAGQVADILRGFRAMALLQYGSDEETKKLIERFDVTTSQQTVQIAWRGAAEGVWSRIEQELQKR